MQRYASLQLVYLMSLRNSIYGRYAVVKKIYCSLLAVPSVFYRSYLTIFPPASRILHLCDILNASILKCFCVLRGSNDNKTILYKTRTKVRCEMNDSRRSTTQQSRSAKSHLLCNVLVPVSGFGRKVGSKFKIKLNLQPESAHNDIFHQRRKV